jgi:molybdopterin-guanine dinucleotide biosynthesis protein A
MGRDKATLPFGDETLLQRVVRVLRPLVDEVVVVARRGQPLPTLPEDVRVAFDLQEDQGPLGGLQAALGASRAEAVYVTGCDVPFLAPALVELLFASLGEAQVAVAEAQGFLHPLAAVYRPGVRPAVGSLLARARRRPVFLYEQVETVRVPEERLRAADPELASLENVNTPEAYERALARQAGEGA